MKAKGTPNDGAAQERAAIRRYIVRERDICHSQRAIYIYDDLLEWISKRTQRTAKCKGGLGRK